MITLTWTNGQSVSIDSTTVVRIRASVPGIDQPGSNTRIDGNVTNFVLEQPTIVAKAIGRELGALVTLNQPSGKSIWLNALKITGPIYVPPELRTDGIQSSVLVGSSTQYLSNTPEEVAAAISGEGGTPEPIRQDVPGVNESPFLAAAALG